MRAASKRSTRTRPSSLALGDLDTPLKRTRSVGSLPSSPRASTPLSRRATQAPPSSTAAVRPTNKEPFNPLPDNSPDILSSPSRPPTTKEMGKTETMSTTIAASATGGTLSIDRTNTASSHTPQRRLEARLKNGHASDSSSLTEVDLDDDSEAETEKLENSPQKRPPRILQQPPPDDAVTAFKVKSALAVVSTPGDDIDETEEVEDVTASRATSPPESPSPSSRKRKRDQTKDSTPATASETTTQKKARPGSNSRKSSPSESIQEPPEDKEDSETLHSKSGDSAAQDDGADEMDVDDKDDKRSQKDGSEDNNEHDNDNESEQNDDKATEKGDDEGDDTARDDEEARKQAMEALTEIEMDFAKLRDKLFDERAAEIDSEIAMVESGTHPQLLAMLEPVDRRRDEQIALANAKFNYSVQSLYTQTKATRAQICSQFLQSAREQREKVLAEVSQMWYQIQRERRTNDTLVPDYTYKLPEKKSVRLQQRQAYDAEVHILSEISKNIGFPAAPDIGGLSKNELEADLEAMGISTRPPPPRPTAASRRAAPVEEHPHPLFPTPVSPSHALPHHHHHHHTHVHHHHIPHAIPPSALHGQAAAAAAAQQPPQPHPHQQQAPPSDLPFRRPPHQPSYPPPQPTQSAILEKATAASSGPLSAGSSIPAGLPPSAILRPHQQAGSRPRQLMDEQGFVGGIGGVVAEGERESPFAHLTTQVLSGKQRY